MLPPSDVAVDKRMVAGPSNIVPPQAAASVEVAQASYTLSPSQKAAQTAQAQPPAAQPNMSGRPMQPAAPSESAWGGLLYVKAAAGMNVMEETDAEGGANQAAIETDFGWIVNGGLGLDLKNGFRLEGEVLYAQSGASQITGTVNGTAVNSGQAEGDVSLLGFMANIAYDFNTPYALTPFVFAGAGVANVSLNGVGAAGAQSYDTSDTVFAMQAGAGLSTELTDRTSVDLSYRYLETLDAQMSDASGAPFDFRYQTHMFLMGLKYKM
jgi:opacity protein-like surface antigen